MTRDFVARWSIALFVGVALAHLAPSAHAQTPAPEIGNEPSTIAELLAADGRFTVLLGALATTGLDSVLAAGTYTVFAPTDSAFAALPEGTLDVLDADQLRTVLLGHVAAGAVTSQDAALAGAAVSEAGTDLTFAVTDGGLTVDDAAIVDADLDASNGVLHVIARVLLQFNEPEEGADD